MSYVTAEERERLTGWNETSVGKFQRTGSQGYSRQTLTPPSEENGRWGLTEEEIAPSGKGFNWVDEDLFFSLDAALGAAEFRAGQPLTDAGKRAATAAEYRKQLKRLEDDFAQGDLPRLFYEHEKKELTERIELYGR